MTLKELLSGIIEIIESNPESLGYTISYKTYESVYGRPDRELYENLNTINDESYSKRISLEW